IPNSLSTVLAPFSSALNQFIRVILNPISALFNPFTGSFEIFRYLLTTFLKRIPFFGPMFGSVLPPQHPKPSPSRMISNAFDVLINPMSSSNLLVVLHFLFHIAYAAPIRERRQIDYFNKPITSLLTNIWAYSIEFGILLSPIITVGMNSPVLGHAVVDYYADFQTQIFTFFLFSVSRSNFRPTKLGIISAGRWIVTQMIPEAADGLESRDPFPQLGIKQAYVPAASSTNIAYKPYSDCLRARVRLTICGPQLDRLLDVTSPHGSTIPRRFQTIPQVGIKHFPRVAIKLDSNLWELLDSKLIPDRSRRNFVVAAPNPIAIAVDLLTKFATTYGIN
ncbi:hypothetical protein PRIPAC_73048, partial [Pristionchus pacificus]|uniref:Uncharacterized protein n=1 Tax=Pristionchus pacificus TaxID=54126 RepID=A0A2A6C8R9_PRIPA